MRLAVDMASIMKTCMYAGTDIEGYDVMFEGKKQHVNTAAYGYENVVNHLVSTLLNWSLTPKDMIFVFEGISTKSPRLGISGDYKGKRRKYPPESNFELEEMQAKLIATFGSLGTTCLTQDYAEGDDTLGYLAFNVETDLVIDSYDNDLSVLNLTNQYGAKVQVTIGGVTGENKYGDFPTKYITVYKALVGDTSDSITGVKGFGVKAWDALYAAFGNAGLSQLHRMAIKGNVYELGEDLSDPIVKKIFDGNDDFIKSYTLAKIHPEWVNTMAYPLQFKAGLINGVSTDERLKRWSTTVDLVTAKTWDKFVKWALPKFDESEYIGLDIETSTPEESDDWLLAQDKEEGVDVMGSELTGMSLTFGKALNHTVYISVDHADTDNVAKDVLRDLIKYLQYEGKQFVIQNCSFEHAVLFNEWGEAFKSNGYEGFLANCLDTKIEASYVNENESLGLKKLSKMYFDYSQVDYATVTTIDGVPHKMRELTGQHVLSYGADDAICCTSLHNFFKLFMELEHTWKVYLDVEIDAMYLHSQSFVHGVKCDVAKLKELSAIDDATYDEAAKTLNAFLISEGWEGSLAPTVTSALTPAEIKAAFLVTQGVELGTRVRALDKIIGAVEAQGAVILAELLRAGDIAAINAYVASKFTAKPVFNTGSPLQLQKLMYEVMKLPIRVYNKPTPLAKSKGARQGSPKTDALAMAYAEKLDATTEQLSSLSALKLMKMVETRRGLYYSTYPYFVHYKTKRIHSGHNQCAANTRRASSSAPNMQQLPKAAKIEGQAARFREVIVPHKKNAVVVSMDFASQEILLLAEWSKDPVLAEVFMGNPPMDMHSMTGVGIYNRTAVDKLSYEQFMEVLHDTSHALHKTIKKNRALGKAINFSGQYRVSASKMATMLFVTETEAQAMIDAKAAAFPVSEQWALDEMANVRIVGNVRSMLGGVRHLASQVLSKDSYEASKADRQALSYRIQGSAAEMTKLAEGRMWRERLEQRFDCEIIAPIHDEVVASCVITDLYEFLPIMHRCMVENYAGMKLPIRSSISFGASLGEQIEIGSEPTREAIEKGLAELFESTSNTTVSLLSTT